MPNDVDERELYRRLADDADRARLTAPEDLRARGDRRTAVRAAAGTVAVVVVVAGVLVGGNGLLGDASPDPVPVDTPTPPLSPTPEPTDAATPLPATIPDSAWLNADDLRSAEVARESNGIADLPPPCGRWLLSAPSGSTVFSRIGSYRAPGVPMDFVPDGTITQTIVVLPQAEAAARVVEEMRQDVANCPEDTHSENRYALADAGLPLSSARPDTHILIDVSEPGLDLGDGNPDPARIHTYISVIQVRDTVTVLVVRGWEASDTDIEDVRRLASAATVRLLDWRE